MASWPASLPQKPLAAGYSDAPPDNVLRTQMDAGPAKLRRRTTAAVRPLAAPFLLTSAQVATLDTFYDTTLEDGALAFDWTHPRTGAAISCRFLQPPVYGDPNGDLFFVTCQLEVLP